MVVFSEQNIYISVKMRIFLTHNLTIYTRDTVSNMKQVENHQNY
jgi:hypothetical protein